MHPSNSPTRDAMKASTVEAQTAAQRSTRSQEAAATRLGYPYSGNVTVDGVAALAEGSCPLSHQVFSDTYWLNPADPALAMTLMPACLVFISAYNDPSGDTTVQMQAQDGPAAPSTTVQSPTSAQEQAALMYGSRYSGDVTGDGAGEHQRHWPNLALVTDLLDPAGPLISPCITEHVLQTGEQRNGGR